MNNNVKTKNNIYNIKMICVLIVGILMLLLITTITIAGTHGYTLRRIVSDSMHPTLYENDICLIKKNTFENVDIGDIICVSTDKGDIIHRVVVKTNKSGKIQLYTKGDNNRKDDKIPVNKTNFIGKVEQIYKLGNHNAE